MGTTSEEVSTQVRYAFQGAKGLQQQRGRNEVTVRVAQGLLTLTPYFPPVFSGSGQHDTIFRIVFFRYCRL
ncbi:hypothetical protein [uncultured Desulfobacter sp.]|uniref:hypothetical protein n=1 Tax=uncultured Desulfobacter sp. TaxID=240139 RepID=UPI0029F45C62|nr:hypothetical protein [uncultured Desulfobacter sp.]